MEEVAKQLSLVTTLDQLQLACTQISASLAPIDVVSVVEQLCGVFAQRNFVAASMQEKSAEVWAQELQRVDEILHKELIGWLSCDGEDVCVGVRVPVFLAVAKLLLDKLARDEPQIQQTAEIWDIRTAFLHQRILEQPAASLRKFLLQRTENITKKHTALLSPTECARIHIEIATIELFHHNAQTARNHLSTAQSLLRVDIKLTGAMTKRMRHQQDERACLFVSVEHQTAKNTKNDPNNTNSNNNSKEEEISFRFPDVSIADENLLERAEPTEPIPGYEETLNGLELSVLIGLAYSYLQVGVVELVAEETRAFFERGARDAKHFLTHLICVEGLSSVYALRGRTAEHTLTIMETIVNAVTSPAVTPTAEDRMKYFFQLPCKPWWELKRELGKVLTQLGLFKTALDIFSDLEDWSRVVSCCIALGRLSQAEEMVVSQLETQGRVPRLLVTLGDIRKDISLFEEAWEVSGHKHTNAKRRLGTYAMANNDFETALRHFDDAIQVNTLHFDTWWNIGMCARETKQHKKAAQAYTECVAQDPTHGKSWNNLAAMLLEMGKEEEAHVTFKEALKHIRDNENMWTNFLVVSVRLRKFTDILTATERIIDLQLDPNIARRNNKQTSNLTVDLDALSAVVDIVRMRHAGEIVDKSAETSSTTSSVDNSVDKEGVVAVKSEESDGENAAAQQQQQQQQLQQQQQQQPQADIGSQPKVLDWYDRRAVALFGRVTARITNNPVVWSLYSKLHSSLGNDDKAVECQISCCRALQSSGWEVQEDTTQHVLMACNKLATLCVNGPPRTRASLFGIRSMLSSALKRAEANYGSLEEVVELRDWLAKVQEMERSAQV